MRVHETLSMTPSYPRTQKPYLNLNLHFKLLSWLTMRHGTVDYVLYDSRYCLR